MTTRAEGGDVANRECRVCGATATFRFASPLAHGLFASYYECRSCGFLFSRHLDDPAALQLVYERASADDDPGAAFRQHCVAQRLATLAQAGVFGSVTGAPSLDFGCGSGFIPGFVGSAIGFRSVGYDRFSSPAFAPSRVLRDWDDVKAAGPFRLVTAIEVIEHFTDPAAGFADIAAVMDPEQSFLYLTTDLYDRTRGADWHYLAPHTAQHCSFYSRRSLEILKERMGAAALRCIGGANEWLFVRGRHSEARLRAAVSWTSVLRRIGATRYFG